MSSSWVPFPSWETRLLGLVIEGACDYCSGRPREENPYMPSDSHDAWNHGWDEAADLFPGDRMLAEVQRWAGPPWYIEARRRQTISLERAA
jgi:ribosome modulation factor